MLTPPSAKLAGTPRPHWKRAELPGCPYGTLICGICPNDVPEHVVQALHPEERQYAERLQGERRREWISGRYCLSAALAPFSGGQGPVLPLPSGAPGVPAGTAGSISHKAALTVAVATDRHRALGIDAECAEDSDERLATKVLTAAERASLAEVSGPKVSFWVTTHFAIKEAIYKAVGAAEQSSIDFERIELAVPLEKLIDAADWIMVPVQITGLNQPISAAILQDGKWVIAVASR